MTGGPGREATRYARAIEELWDELRGAPSLFSQRDWALICDWYARGIPLELLRETFQAAGKRRGRSGSPRGLSYLSRAVEEAWSVVCEGRLGGEGPGPGQERGPTLDAWRHRADDPDCGEPLAALLRALLGRHALGSPLADLEEQLERELAEATPAALRAEIGAELRAELAPFRGRLSERVYNETFHRARIRRLRERLELPRLATEGGSS